MGGKGLCFLSSLSCLRFSLKNPKEVASRWKIHIGKDWRCLLPDAKVACGSDTKSKKKKIQAVQAEGAFALSPTDPLSGALEPGTLNHNLISVSSWLPLYEADVELHCFPLLFTCRPPQPWLVNYQPKLLRRKLQGK